MAEEAKGPQGPRGAREQRRPKRGRRGPRTLLAALLTATVVAGSAGWAVGSEQQAVTGPVPGVGPWRADRSPDLHGRPLPDPATASPAEVARFFAGLTGRQREALVERHALVVGNLDGAPPALRYAANSRALQAARAEELARAADPELPGQDRAAARARAERYAELGAPGRQILAFDPRGRGQVAEVYGDLAHADHVAVIVPGSDIDLNTFDRTKDRYGTPSGMGRALYAATTEGGTLDRGTADRASDEHGTAHRTTTDRTTTDRGTPDGVTTTHRSTPESSAADPTATNRTTAGHTPTATNPTTAGRTPTNRTATHRTTAGRTPTATNRTTAGPKPTATNHTTAGPKPTATNRTTAGRTPTNRPAPERGAAHRTTTHHGTPDDAATASRPSTSHSTPTPHTAVIAWAGYTTPVGLGPDAATGRLAEAGAPRLVRLVQGVVAAGGPRPALFCHSYGSVVCGLAAPEVPAADLVVAGSPGMRVDRAADLRTGARVWAAKDPDDWIDDVPHVQLLGLGHGADPTDPAFGARPVPAARAEGHTGYFVPGTDSLRAFAAIARGASR